VETNPRFQFRLSFTLFLNLPFNEIVAEANEQ